MEISKFLENKLKPLNGPLFERLRDEKLRPQFNLDGLRLLRLQSLRERDLRELYRNRAPYELLQNADDVGARRALFILSDDGVAFAHDGKWFTVDNFRNLAEGWSDKDPNQCIGHKGLGFRSVLDITPAPHLLKVDSTDFFAIKFTWALNNGHIQETLRRDPSLSSDYKDWTKHGQPCCPIMSIPSLVKKKEYLGGAFTIFNTLVHGKYDGDKFTTMFWFPAKDPDIETRVFHELGPTPITSSSHGREVLLDFLEREVAILLPFLKSIREVKVYEDDDCIGLISMSGHAQEQKVGDLTVFTRINRQSYSASFFQMRFTSPIPQTIRNKPDTPKALKSLDKVNITLSARIEKGKPVYDEESRFHVYFPTEEATGVGFTIHADFFIKPDRTRLMSGDYNEWLLDIASKKAANEFLTQLLQKYPARSVFEALSSTGRSTQGAPDTFVRLFSKALTERKAPFIPTRIGMLNQDKVILPPFVDEDGFWEKHFSDIACNVIQRKNAFLSHEEDGERTRTFLQMAGVQTIDAKSLIDFIEADSEKVNQADWWYECYSFMASDPKLSRYDHSFFIGRRLIPITNSSTIPVPDENDLVVCLPPAIDMRGFKVPDCFSHVFVFLNTELTDLLMNGKDTIKSWVLDRLRIARFEATDLLPRAIRGVIAQVFDGELTITGHDLKQAWSFIKKIIDSSRSILSSTFWNEIGRFPLPLHLISLENKLNSNDLVPAFLAYWPDSFLENNRCLLGIKGLRRIDEFFLNQLISDTATELNDWFEFLSRAGVLASPKLLKYSRVVARGQDLPFDYNAPENFGIKGYTGERQTDENLALVEALKAEHLWKETVENATLCEHEPQKVLQSLTLIEGLSACAQLAQQEYQNGNDNWRSRLWLLIRDLPISSLSDCEIDEVFCRGGSRGGHSIPLGRYLLAQLNYFPWLPSSQGPMSAGKCFARLSSRRLISSGQTGEELGDKLLPYVVADNINELARLQTLGVGSLDDASSASPADLVRALKILGERLSTEWGKKEILNVRSRWRLVRGAIQEIYRALNQIETPVQGLHDIRISCRYPHGVRFLTDSLYYAEPGSAIEQAFLGILPLIDVDRTYPRLFEQLRVIRLNPGQTVNELLLGEDTSIQAQGLKEEITEGLAPFLLAPIIAKSEKGTQVDLILRKLRTRFEIKTTDRLIVTFNLKEDSSISQTIDFIKFYLQTRIIQSTGAIKEEHYTLYVSGKNSVSLSDLDGDALGEVLFPVFADRGGDDLFSLFPRIVSRYQQLHGNRARMEEFMYHQLHISKEALDLAGAAIQGLSIQGQYEAIIAPPPPLKVISVPRSTTSLNDQRTIEEMIQQHQDRLEKKTKVVLNLVTSVSKKEPSLQTATDPVSKTFRTPLDEVTPEQKDRGKRGEDEIKRRLELPGGWEGFILAADKRNEGCGFDFLCALGEGQVKLEVKTFVQDGRIFLTNRELQEAAASQDNYYLIGLLDDEKPCHTWSAFLIRNPIGLLLAKGEFDVQTQLHASAEEVFNLNRI